MIVHNGVLSTINAEITSGYDGGRWDGSGIISSAAIGSFETTLGVISNDINGQIFTHSFTGQPAVISDILVRYTYYGDADLSGAVTAADYLQIDNAFDADQAYYEQNPGGNAPPLTGWYNGDFNYDGFINGDDYTLIDNAYNSQGSVSFEAVPASQIASNTAQIAGASKASTVAVSSSKEVRQFAVMVANPTTGDNIDSQELKKRRAGVWEMLES
jgi:hypothetical protein